MRKNSRDLRRRSRAAALVLPVIAALVAGSPVVEAAGLLDMLFGSARRAPSPPAPVTSYSPPSSGIFGLFGPGSAEPAPQSSPSGIYSAHCVRLCDGRHFPVAARGSQGAAQMCQAFCPAARTRIFSGSGIDHAVAPDGYRYADLPNAYLYREKLVSDCTCNGRDSVGLAPVDISLDATLRNGDIVATTDGLLAYNGGRPGSIATFTPVNNYPGLSQQTREKLGEMKVAPVAAQIAQDVLPETTGSIYIPRAKRSAAR